MKKVFVSFIKKMQILFILLVGVCVLIYYISNSNEVSHKQVISSFTEIKNLLGQEEDIQSNFRKKLIEKCKLTALNKEKLLASEIRFCRKMLNSE